MASTIAGLTQMPLTKDAKIAANYIASESIAYLTNRTSLMTKRLIDVDAILEVTKQIKIPDFFENSVKILEYLNSVPQDKEEKDDKEE